MMKLDRNLLAPLNNSFRLRVSTPGRTGRNISNGDMPYLTTVGIERDQSGILFYIDVLASSSCLFFYGNES